MRRLNFARPTLFPGINTCITTKREMGFPSANQFNFLMRFLQFSGCAAMAGFTGLIFWAYKQEYSESKARQEKWDVSKFELVPTKPINGVNNDFAWLRPMDLPKVKTPEVPFGPKTEREAKPTMELDLSGFKIDSEGYWSKPGPLWKVKQESSPKP